MPKDFLYYVTIFSPPAERIQTLARDDEGRLLRNDEGKTYHHVINYEDWLKQEAARLKREISLSTAVEKRSDGEIALYAKKL